MPFPINRRSSVALLEMRKGHTRTGDIVCWENPRINALGISTRGFYLSSVIGCAEYNARSPCEYSGISILAKHRIQLSYSFSTHSAHFAIFIHAQRCLTQVNVFGAANSDTRGMFFGRRVICPKFCMNFAVEPVGERIRLKNWVSRPLELNETFISIAPRGKLELLPSYFRAFITRE